MPAVKPPSETNATLVADFMQAVWTGGRTDLIDDFIGAGFSDHAYAPADKNGHANMVRLFSTAFSGATHAIEQCVAQGDTVIVRLRITARHTGTPIRIRTTAAATSASVLFAPGCVAVPALTCQVFRVTPLIAEMIQYATRWDEGQAKLDAGSQPFLAALAGVTRWRRSRTKPASPAPACSRRPSAKPWAKRRPNTGGA